jgi:hypothetical protein
MQLQAATRSRCWRATRESFRQPRPRLDRLDSFATRSVGTDHLLSNRHKSSLDRGALPSASLLNPTSGNYRSLRGAAAGGPGVSLVLVGVVHLPPGHRDAERTQPVLDPHPIRRVRPGRRVAACRPRAPRRRPRRSARSRRAKPRLYGGSVGTLGRAPSPGCRSAHARRRCRRAPKRMG